MEQIFLYQQWLHQRLEAYVQPSRPSRLRGRKIALSPIQYGAALMQAYLGSVSLEWITEHTGISLERLRHWRRQPEFLLVMDWSKSIFAADFHEKLMLNDYSVLQYHYIAAEISILERSLRVAVRYPLSRGFTKLGRSLASRHKHDIDLENYDLRLFRRLFLFFMALEHHWPSPAQHYISEEFLPLAKAVVWPLLGQNEWVGPELESIQQTVPISRAQRLLGSKLKETITLISLDKSQLELLK